MKNTKKKRLGERLVERGSVSQTDLESALTEQRGRTILLGDLLLSRGLVAKEDLASTLKELLGIEYLDLTTVKVDPAALKLLSREVAVKSLALPLYKEGTKLVVAMANPQDIQFIDRLRFRIGMDILPVLSFGDEIVPAIEDFYGTPPQDADGNLIRSAASLAGSVPHSANSANLPRPGGIVRTSAELSHQLVPTEEDESVHFEMSKVGLQESGRDVATEVELARQNQDTPAVRVFSSIILRAYREKASDIHIDPQINGSVVRLRVDGMLRDLMEVPPQIKSALISRIKILADMNISERRAPQDGRIMVQMGASKLDLRVSTLPTQHGEKTVIRLLDPESAQVDFAALGLSETTREALRKVLMQPQGMLLVTGPTGSGKTTTLYAALNQIRSRTKNIITVEDPVEYMLEGINQVQVNAKAGRTFAACLRSILRQDPNVIMVGEIRDAETAEIALSSSQTGHMVLSTLHTNDSVAAITRLLDLGMPGYMISASVSAIVAQRLVRKLCICSKEEDVAPEFSALLLSAGMSKPDSMFVPVGCSLCHDSGYKGRVGVYEILFVNEQLRGGIQSGASADELRRIARASGLKLMQEEALAKAKTGQTSLEEVFRVFTFESSTTIRCTACQRDLGPGFLYCPYCGVERASSTDRAKKTLRIAETGARI